MNLKEFISETLLQIIEGVKDAQEKASKHNGKVNPDILMDYKNFNKMNVLESSSGREIVQIIDFDVALTVIEGTKTKGGIGVFAAGFGIGSQGQSNAENASVSRIKFQIPVTFTPLKK